ncbi:11978_t:CDS:2, partial [Cetraspora pellucida]
TMNVNELITNNNIFTNTPNNLDESSNASNSDFSLPSYQKVYKSPVWNYFKTDILEYPDQPVCEKCSDVFASTSGTSTLRRHLESHQIIVPKKIQKKTSYYNIPYSINEQQERDDVVIEWIISNTQPFSTVENKAWRRMITKFDPHYQFHNRHTIKNFILTLYDKKKEQLKLIIDNIPGKVSFTSDMWTASNGSAFLSLTIHYIDSSWRLRNFLLDIVPMAVRHTGVNMCNAIMDVLHEFNLTEKALALTTDNASSMIVCGATIAEELDREFDNLSFSHYRCATHILNLAVSKGIELVDKTITKIRSLMLYIKDSHPINNTLKELCNIKNINYLKPEIDIKIRWNSTFYMLEKWKRLEPAFYLLAADNQLVHQRYPSIDDCHNIDDIMVLLRPIERATQFLSASTYPTHGDYIFTKINGKCNLPKIGTILDNFG